MQQKKPLIIAEKPSAARAIAEALGGFAKAEGYLESGAYLLSWALGHLVELNEPEDYDPALKRWSLETLPILPAEFRTKVVAKTRGQLRVLQQLARRASGLINACDAGREGELIFRYIMEQLPAGPLPARRLWVSSLTREAIRKGFQDLRPLSEYDRLHAAAVCRARGDWLVGMNATRAFTCRFGELYSVGRVQTPTLALLVRREQEIRQFRPEPYWEVTARFQPHGMGPDGEYTGKWFGPDGDRVASAETAEAIVQRARAAGEGRVVQRQEKEAAERPPQLYDLTSLQREANRRYGLTAAATLKAAQELYERRLITYPRTDSRYLTRDVARTVTRPLNALARLGPYQPLVQGADPQRIWNGRVVNDARVTDHHAIIPTGEPVPPLSGQAAQVFDLVARRFLAQFYPEARFLEVDLVTQVGSDQFRTRGRQMLQEGWRAVEPPAAGKAEGKGPRRRKAAEQGEGPGEGGPPEEGPPLPAVAQGQAVRVLAASAEQKETQPPRRFTEAALLGAMEAAGKEFDDDALREAMKGRGLGTPATRAAIIERLKRVGYITARGKLLLPTEKGERLVELVRSVGVPVLLSAELTGEWEKRIGDIQAGQEDPGRLLTAMGELTRQVVGQVKAAAGPGAPPPALQRRGSGATAGESAADAVPVRAGSCPRCRQSVSLQGRDWRCAGDGCGLRIPGFLCGKRIGPELAGILLREGKTPLIPGFISPRTGKEFSAYLLLQEQGVAFEFPPARSGRKGTSASGGRSGRKGPAHPAG